MIKKLLISFTFFLLTYSTFAQYNAIELNIGSSRYLDDNIDQEFEYNYSNVKPLGNYNLGFSFPISPKFLLTPKLGVTTAKESYIRNPDSSFNFMDGDFDFLKDKSFFFGRAIIESTYWFKPNYAGFFLSGALSAVYNISANSKRTMRTYDASKMEFIEAIENLSIKDQFNSIVPAIRLGIGYNLNLFTHVNFFAVTHLEYRPTGYYKDTKNVSHLGRTVHLGVKYVIKGGTSILKKKDTLIKHG